VTAGSAVESALASLPARSTVGAVLTQGELRAQLADVRAQWAEVQAPTLEAAKSAVNALRMLVEMPLDTEQRPASELSVDEQLARAQVAFNRRSVAAAVAALDLVVVQ
jgi:hypothetical protein